MKSAGGVTRLKARASAGPGSDAGDDISGQLLIEESVCCALNAGWNLYETHFTLLSVRRVEPFARLLTERFLNFDPHRAIAQLAEKLNLPDLAFDESGQCVLATEDFEVYLDLVTETDSLFVYAKIGELAGTAPLDFYKALLDANFLNRGTAGCTIGLDDRSGVILLSTRWALQELDDEIFEPRLLDVCEAIDFWVTRIRVLLEESVPDRGGAESISLGAAALSAGSMIRG